MSKKRIYSYSGLILIVLSIWLFSKPSSEQTEFSEKVKISLRNVGNQLLLTNKDTTSLILPVKEIASSKYELSFESKLAFEPNTLVSIVEESFEKSQLPKVYRVEVIQCADEEVAYSYEVSQQEEKTIIPCAGRLLPTNCYTIQVRFIARKSSFGKVSNYLYLFVLILFIVMELLFLKKKPAEKPTASSQTYESIGSFHFYPTQNKLVKQTTEINLSKKECELLQIFVANPNQIVTRDELTKKVWEDNGVIVGRSLDTYISKLRKKLKDDESIKLTNVHGVGYKLEIDM